MENAINAALVAPLTKAETLIAEAVRLQMAAEGLDEAHAAIRVRLKLAALAKEKGEWSTAESHLGAALVLATALEDADLMIRFLLERSEARFKAEQRSPAVEDAQAAWELARRAQRTPAQLQAGLMVTQQLNAIGRPQLAEPFFDEMAALPGADVLALAVERARMATGYDAAVAEAHWRKVLELARAAKATDTEAQALDALGSAAAYREQWPEAAEFFKASETLAPARQRTAWAWRDYSKALSALGDKTGARRAVEAALAGIDAQMVPGTAADLEDARARILSELDDPAGAYAALRRSIELRGQASAGSMRMRAARIVPTTATSRTDQAAALAAARHALREAELAQVQLERRTAWRLAASGAAVAAALALAYVYKRRAARALAAARDAAELRAERTHWQMLRYQINPHFLFNALSSLSGLVATDPAAARRMVGRLSDFCRRALQRTTDELRTVDDELGLLTAFVDVEQAGAGDALRVEFAVDPAARAARLPPLLLQPLLENAIKYGDAGADGLRRMVVSIRREASSLQIEVANTGGWVDPQRRRGLRSSGVGLANVRERLARFGAAAGLSTATEPGWVRVRVTLPVLDGETATTI